MFCNANKQMTYMTCVAIAAAVIVVIISVMVCCWYCFAGKTKEGFYSSASKANQNLFITTTTGKYYVTSKYNYTVKQRMTFVDRGVVQMVTDNIANQNINLQIYTIEFWNETKSKEKSEWKPEGFLQVNGTNSEIKLQPDSNLATQFLVYPIDKIRNTFLLLLPQNTEQKTDQITEKDNIILELKNNNNKLRVVKFSFKDRKLILDSLDLNITTNKKTQNRTPNELIVFSMEKPIK